MNIDSEKLNAELVETLFNAALACPLAQRAAYLAEACGDNVDLRQRVEALLSAHETCEGFLPQTPRSEAEASCPPRRVACGSDAMEALAANEKPGDRIGNYKLREKIGEGGCGIVYVAEQEEPVKRRVALKVIKLGMDTKSVIARFEAERQALALMDHPNIAKVFDAGATETGRPFFVMELVRGIKITNYCDQNSVPTRERLELFQQVCRAIQHAHQKGIIHRDIKPSNILVMVNDGVAVPKVIDFGIAKATTGPLTDKTIYTAFEQFLGTPAYMSPEQAEMTGVDIDTRSDIYSLGVLLYELLTGKTPFETTRLANLGLDEIRRIIREEDPVRPSTRLHTLDAVEQTTVAKHRQTLPPKLIHLIDGDLDWIVMKCLEKDRTRRYETANGLAMDVQRHLKNEPVVACPPSAAYRLRKTIYRNKLAFGAGAAVVASLVVGLVLAGWFMTKETKQRKIAQAERNRAAAAQKQAQAAELLAETRANQLREALRLWHSGITNLNQTETFFRETLQAQRKSSGNDSFELVPALQDLASIEEMQGKLAEATATSREALALQIRALGEDHPDVIATLGAVGSLLQRQGKLQEAEATFRQAITQARHREATKPLEQDHHLGIVLHHLADVLREERSLTEARALAQEAVTLYEQHSEWPSEERSHAQTVLANVLKEEGDSSEAQQLLSRVRQTKELKAQAMSHGMHGEWQAAQADLLQLVELDHSDHWSFFVLAPLLIQSGDLAGYRKNCRAMLALFGNAQNPMIAERVAKTCLLFPSAVTEDELGKVWKLAEFAVETGQNSQWLHWFQLTRGLSEYRQGHFSNAVEWMLRVQGRVPQARDSDREKCKADSYLVLSMALQQLNQRQEARAALARGVELVQTQVPSLDEGSYGPTWHDVLIPHILLREAQALMEGQATGQEEKK